MNAVLVEAPLSPRVRRPLQARRTALLKTAIRIVGKREIESFTLQGLPDELRPAIGRSLAGDPCVLIHVDVAPKAHKFAPALATFKEMYMEPQRS